MTHGLRLSEQDVCDALAAIPDPEIPVISLVDLSVVRDVAVEGERVRVRVHAHVPGLSGARGDARCDGRLDRDDSWSTDTITPVGRAKLRVAGFAPPAPREAGKPTLVQLTSAVFRCPYCSSTGTRLENIFGPTPCRSLRYCNECRQPFEQFKTI